MTINRNDITAVILAGGKGTRLGGQDKGLVHYNGKPLIEHVIERIKPQVKTILINANRNQDIYEKYGYPVISDDMQDYQGPLAGFASAMSVAETNYLLTLPCDGPLLPLDISDRMMTGLENASLGISVAHDGQRLQPVHALIPTALVDSLNAFLAQGDRKIVLWYKKHDFTSVDFSDIPEAFVNINTEEQRQDLEQNA